VRLRGGDAELAHLGDVTGDGGSADHGPVLIADRGHRHQHREAGAVLALPDGLVVRDALASADLRQDVEHLALPSAGDSIVAGWLTASSGAYPYVRTAP
jgi:hypothetical protein